MKSAAEHLIFALFLLLLCANGWGCSGAPEAPDALVLSPAPEACGMAFDVPDALLPPGQQCGCVVLFGL